MSTLVTRAQALATGCTPAEIDASVRSGRWLAVRRGTYWTASTLPDEPEVRAAVVVQAAVLASGVPSVGSHESAALVHGLPLFVPYVGSPLVTRLRDRATVRPDARRCAPLVSQVPQAHATRLHGAEVTTLSRTAVDLARTRRELTAVVVLDAALARGVSREELAAVLEVQAGWPGSARAAVRAAFANGLAESPLESIGRLRMAQLELPPPELQVVLGGEHHNIGRVDFYWAEHRTIGEADGRTKYRMGDDTARGLIRPPDAAHAAAGRPCDPLFEEKLREDEFRDSGYEVFRFTWAEAVHRPEVLRDRALRAFARSRRRR